MITMIAKRVPTALAIAKALGIKRSSPPPQEEEFILNWGTQFEEEREIINKPSAVRACSNKLVALDTLRDHDIPTVPYTTDPGEAFQWHCDGRTVYARMLLRSSQGRGITLVRPEPRLGEENFHWMVEGAKLFTRFVQADSEYRVHVFDGKVVDFARKKRRRMENPPPGRYWVRSHANGWVLARDGVAPPPEDVQAACIRAVNALGLHFGACDVLIRGRKFYLLEVNSAPGLTGKTLESYVKAIKEYISE